jgi:hypothetical protein
VSVDTALVRTPAPVSGLAPSPLGISPTAPGAGAGAGEGMSLLASVVAAAVDPLEIAASLETFGLSNAVVQKRFSHDDVFGLAQQLYTMAQFEPAPAAKRRKVRPGGPVDLGRGIIFAAPTLMFTGAALALRSSLSWWTVPLALICGWAFSQALSYIGFSRDAWGEAPGAAVVWALLAALISTAGLGLAGDSVLGGRYAGVLFAAASCVFMTAAAELVVHGEERIIGALLLPGAIGSLVFITRVPFALPVQAVVALSGASVVATLFASLRHLPARWWRQPLLTAADASTVARYFATGLCCGFFVGLFIVLEPAKSGSHSWPAAAAYPMILSLGAMEWQLRSLRAGASGASFETVSLGEFRKGVRKRLARSAFSYLVVLAFMTAAVQALAHFRGVVVPTPLLAAGTCLALAFFFALVVSSSGRTELVLRAWLVGLVTLATWALLVRVVHPSWQLPSANFAFLIAASVSAVALALAAWRAVVNPFSYA